jgi:hypothetical protein
MVIRTSTSGPGEPNPSVSAPATQLRRLYPTRNPISRRNLEVKRIKSAGCGYPPTPNPKQTKHFPPK